MSFSSPAWLLALVPWAAVTVWLLWGRRKRQPVPFLPLWQGAVQQKQARWSVQPPPMALALALLAMLLAVLAAAAPLWPRSAGGGPALTVILDRGLTMSVKGPSGVPRFTAAAESAAGPILDALGPGPVELIDVPSLRTTMTDRNDWARVAAIMTPTAADTRAALVQAIAGRTDPILVISDHAPLDDRVVAVSPAPLDNVAVIAIAARTSPSPQIMVRLRNHSQQTRAVIECRSAGAAHHQEIALGLTGGQTDYFLNPPSLGPTVDVRLGAGPAERAFLVRQPSPRVQARPGLGESVRWLVQNYSALEAPDAGAPPVLVAPSLDDLPACRAGIVVDARAATADPLDTGPSAAPIQWAPHPVTDSVIWSRALTRARAVAPGPDWSPLVWAGPRVLLAARTDPVRQLWIGFDSPDWPQTVDFVVFWKNALDWAGGASRGFTSIAPTLLGPGWQPLDPADPPPTAAAELGLWPGIYRRSSDGALRAVNPPDVPFDISPPSPAQPPWPSRLRALAAGPQPRSAAPVLLVLALACLAASSLTWRKRTLPVGMTFEGVQG